VVQGSLSQRGSNSQARQRLREESWDLQDVREDIAKELLWMLGGIYSREHIAFGKQVYMGRESHRVREQP
jgi:hypothetical protein